MTNQEIRDFEMLKEFIEVYLFNIDSPHFTEVYNTMYHDPAVEEISEKFFPVVLQAVKESNDKEIRRIVEELSEYYEAIEDDTMECLIEIFSERM